MSIQLPHIKAMDSLRELLPINYIALTEEKLILGSQSGCTSLRQRELANLIKDLVELQLELSYRQVQP